MPDVSVTHGVQVDRPCTARIHCTRRAHAQLAYPRTTRHATPTLRPAHPTPARQAWKRTWCSGQRMSLGNARAAGSHVTDSPSQDKRAVCVDAMDLAGQGRRDKEQRAESSDLARPARPWTPSHQLDFPRGRCAGAQSGSRRSNSRHASSSSARLVDLDYRCNVHGGSWPAPSQTSARPIQFSAAPSRRLHASLNVKLKLRSAPCGVDLCRCSFPCFLSLLVSSAAVRLCLPVQQLLPCLAARCPVLV
ncbi:hypothetical protein PMIN01_10307 [Paraphaeosphaeria minitans]|uniref:Uncharacterized protein n=1 Tax=Paraphaeosphaeria minitans TaxID=565426 RepID=A0A9P6KLW3_9PLEO|nr:hypothetical protein PMIN01_10307 [Paraphaeosphaeria minitans]